MPEATAAAPDQSTERRGLDPADQAFFETFGFVRLPGVFASDIAAVTDAFEDVFAATPAADELTELNVETMDEALARPGRIDSFHHLHQGRHRAIIPDFVERDPRLERLLDDPRLVGPVTSILGPGYEYHGSDGNVLDCDTSWHCDVYGSPLERYHLKVLFYLDALDASNGALRVIPGTNFHDSPFAHRLRRDLDDWQQVGATFGVAHDEVPCTTVPTEPGDVVLLNFRTMHATFNSDEGRRLFTINFRQAQPHPATAPGTVADPA